MADVEKREREDEEVYVLTPFAVAAALRSMIVVYPRYSGIYGRAADIADECDTLLAELARIKPVVEAAKKYDAFPSDENGRDLRRAVRKLEES